MEKKDIEKYEVWCKALNLDPEKSDKAITEMIIAFFDDKKYKIEQKYNVNLSFNIYSSYKSKNLYYSLNKQVNDFERSAPKIRHGRDVFMDLLGMTSQYERFFTESVTISTLNYFFLESVIKKEFEEDAITFYSRVEEKKVQIYPLSVVFEKVVCKNIPYRLKNEKAYTDLKKRIANRDGKIDFLLTICKHLEKLRRERELISKMESVDIKVNNPRKKI